MGNVKYTGYWSFICDPRKWGIDRFLNDMKNEKRLIFDSWTINDWQKDAFKVGQLGVIRVSQDKRTKKILNGRKRLKSGIYAIVKVNSLPKKKKMPSKGDKYTIDKDSSFLKNEYYVELEYLHNLIDNPITIDYLKIFDETFEDPYLIKGFQGYSIPLNEEAFNKINELTQETIIYEVSDTKNSKKVKKNIISVTETERETVIKQRVGHSRLKKLLLENESKCKVCGIDDERLLIASHIKPWKESTDKEKLDLDNVMLLCPIHDKLFDRGLISFKNNGDIVISNSLSDKTKTTLGLKNDIKIKIDKESVKFLEWHREKLFQK